MKNEIAFATLWHIPSGLLAHKYKCVSHERDTRINLLCQLSILYYCNNNDNDNQTRKRKKRYVYGWESHK